jgi:hypothetical protein
VAHEFKASLITWQDPVSKQTNKIKLKINVKINNVKQQIQPNKKEIFQKS